MTSETMAKILARIEQNERDGVSVSRKWEPASADHGVPVAIYWQPGDPNALAYAIMRNVTDEDMRLILDGNTYVVRKVD